jgi:hypothetical protein
MINHWEDIKGAECYIEKTRKAASLKRKEMADAGD